MNKTQQNNYLNLITNQGYPACYILSRTQFTTPFKFDLALFKWNYLFSEIVHQLLNLGIPYHRVPHLLHFVQLNVSSKLNCHDSTVYYCLSHTRQ